MRVLFFLVSFCLWHPFLKGSTIDILTDFWNDLPSIEFQDEIGNGCGFRVLNVELNDYASHYFTEDVKWVILMNQQNSSALSRLPKEKMALFVWEPDNIDPKYCELFSRIYTYNDYQIDNVKYFKFYYPFLRLPKNFQTPWEERKFCTLVARHWIPKRIQILEFFNSKHESNFEFYGTLPSEKYQGMYKGKIPGSHSGEEKIEVLQQYRFCICFENSSIPGYITEKIFACFAAGCVPIYLGAPNILDYIPADCFIDYRSFKNEEELYQYLKNMPESRYQEYLKSISTYLISDQASCFSPTNFKIILQGLVNK